MDPQVVRYSERPELWDSISGLSDEVWPEYNQHGETLDYYWAQLHDVLAHRARPAKLCTRRLLCLLSYTGMRMVAW